MNDNVVSFPGRKEQGIQLETSDRDTHLSGKAKCLACKHEWAAVAPTGYNELECPECKTWRGVFIGQCAPSEGTPSWECGCGNNLFWVTAESVVCCACGTYADFK